MKLRTSSLKLVIAMMLSSTVYAASDGTLGLTSTGTTDLNLTKGDSVQITKINDVTWGPYASSYNSTVNEDQTDDVCVYSSTGLYDVTLSSPNWNANQFRLHDGAGTYINYAINWDFGGANDVITASTPYDNAGAGYVGDNTNVDCGGAAATNVQIRYRIASAALNAAPVGVYTDTLTMLITPH